MKRGTWSIAIFAAASLAPIAASLVYAALYSFGLAGLLGRGLTLAHWRATLAEPGTWSAIGLSLWIATAVVLISTAVGLALALAFGGDVVRGRLSYVFYMPLALPATVAAFFVYQMLNGTGLLARVGVGSGLLRVVTDAPVLVNDSWGVGIIVTHALLATPFLALMFRGLYESERLDALSGVAAGLGAGPVARLARLVLPVLLRRGAPTLALIFVVVLGSYEVPLLLGRQTPQMLSVVVLRKYARFDLHEKPEAFVLALIYGALALAALVVLFRHVAAKTEAR